MTKDSVPERRAIRRARAFRHACIIWILGFFDLLCYVTGKAPMGVGLFSAALFLYIAYLVS